MRHLITSIPLVVRSLSQLPQSITHQNLVRDIWVMAYDKLGPKRPVSHGELIDSAILELDAVRPFRFENLDPIHLLDFLRIDGRKFCRFFLAICCLE